MKKQPSRNHVEIMFAFEIFHETKYFLESVTYGKDVYIYEKSQEINCVGFFFK